MFSIQYFLFFNVSQWASLYSPPTHLFRRPHSQLCFKEMPLTRTAWGNKKIGSMTSSSFLRRTDDIHPCSHRGQTHSPQTNLAGLIGAVWRWRAPFFAIAIMSTVAQTHVCTPTCANAVCAGSGQNVMLHDNTLICWIWIHWDLLAHTRILHSVTYQMSASVCLFLMCFKCISKIDFLFSWRGFVLFFYQKLIMFLFRNFSFY